MHHLKTVLLATALLLSASRVRADDRELYHAEVCNKGQLTVDVAIAYRDFGFNDEFWVIDRWWHIRGGECKVVFSHTYAPNNVLNFRPFPLHLAFAFTDSTGVWGAAKVEPPGDIARSHLKLCVAKNDQKYREDHDDPATACKKSSEGFLIPASIDWEPTHGSTCCQYGDYGPPIKFTVALGPNDRAVPLGPRTSTGGPAPTPAARPVTARLVMGDKVRFDGSRWLNSLGDPLPEDLIDPKTGHPPLLPKSQHSTNTAPVQAYITQIKDVMKSVHACTDDLVLMKRNVVSSGFDMEDTGAMASVNVHTDSEPGSMPSPDVQAAALGNLLLSNARLEDRGCVLLIIPCKNSEACAQWIPNRATQFFSVLINTREQGQRVLDALKALAPFYPDGRGEIHETATNIQRK
jgi:hypothetical protein